MRISDWSSDVCSSDLHDVADNQVDALRAQDRARLGGTRRRAHCKALRLEIFAQRFADRRLVVDQQDARGVAVGHLITNSSPTGLVDRWAIADRKSTRLNSSH